MWVPGQSLQSGKYQIIRLIGGGGFGIAYLAQNLFLNRLVVIKSPNNQYKTDEDYDKYVRRFQREGQVLSKVNHPNIVRVIDYFQEDSIPCLVLDYVEGETLGEYVRSKEKLSEEVAISCFHKLAQALQAIHKEGIIHCDIHPGNIILRSKNDPMIIDFGSTKLLQPSTFTITTTVNEYYVPYEQRAQQVSPQPTLDIYGLAATLYFAVTGSEPQASIDRKIYGDKLKAPNELCSSISDSLNRAILQGMALEPGKRPKDMGVFESLLQLRPLSSKLKKSNLISKSLKSEASSGLNWLWFLGQFLVSDIGLLSFPIIYTILLKALGFPTVGLIFIILFLVVAWRMAVAPRRKYKKRNFWKSILIGIRRLLYSIFILFISGFLIRSFIQHARFVSGGHIRPVLKSNDRVLVDKNSYLFREPKRGEIILYWRDEQTSGLPTAFIGMIVGLPGEAINLEDKRILIDGSNLRLPFDSDDLEWVFGNSLSEMDSQNIPSNTYIVTNGSNEDIGFNLVDDENIEGRVYSVFWPPEHIKIIDSSNHQWTGDSLDF